MNITIDRKTIFIGRFDKIEDAKEAFLNRYFGHYGKFPPEYKPIVINEGVRNG